MAPQLKVVAVATDTQRDSRLFDTTKSYSVIHESGQIMDQIGFGTWGLKPHEVDSAVRHAVEAGYRLFDLSPVYGNEKEIGQTLTALMAEGKLTRDSIFLTSKVEHHPYNANRELRAYCASLRPPIRITAYSSLGSATRPAKYQHDQPRLLDDPTIVRIAAKRGASPSAIAMAWAIHDPNVAIIPKSAHADRIASNLLETRAIAAVLRADEMQQLDQLDRGFHYLEEAWKGHAWRPGMTLEELYDDPAPSLFGFSLRLRDLIPLAGVLMCLVYIVQRRAQSRGRWLPVQRDED